LWGEPEQVWHAQAQFNAHKMSTVGDVGLQSCWHSADVHNAGTELTD